MSQFRWTRIPISWSRENHSRHSPFFPRSCPSRDRGQSLEWKPGAGGRCSGQGTRTSMYGSCILSAAHPQIPRGLTADPMLCNGLLPAVDRLSHASRKTEPLTQDLKRTVPFSEHPNFEFGTISDPLYIAPHEHHKASKYIVVPAQTSRLFPSLFSKQCIHFSVSLYSSMSSQSSLVGSSHIFGPLIPHH